MVRRGEENDRFGFESPPNVNSYSLRKLFWYGALFLVAFVISFLLNRETAPELRSPPLVAGYLIFLVVFRLMIFGWLGLLQPEPPYSPQQSFGRGIVAILFSDGFLWFSGVLTGMDFTRIFMTDALLMGGAFALVWAAAQWKSSAQRR